MANRFAVTGYYDDNNQVYSAVVSANDGSGAFLEVILAHPDYSEESGEREFLSELLLLTAVNLSTGEVSYPADDNFSAASANDLLEHLDGYKPVGQESGVNELEPLSEFDALLAEAQSAGVWDDNEFVSVETWRSEVENDNTRSSYRDFVISQISSLHDDWEDLDEGGRPAFRDWLATQR